MRNGPLTEFWNRQFLMHLTITGTSQLAVRRIKDIVDLPAILITDGLQAILTTIFVTIAYAAVLAFVVSATAIALPVTVIALGLLAVTRVFGIGVAMAFSRFGVTDGLASVIRETGATMEKFSECVSNLIREAGKLLGQQIPADYGSSYSESSRVIFPAQWRRELGCKGSLIQWGWHGKNQN